MGWLSNRPVAKSAVRTGVQTVPIRKLYGSHSPDRHRVKPWRGSCPPITVERNGSRFRLVDGASRVESARRAGVRTIRAEVWETCR